MVDFHKAGKGYKSISKSIDVHQSMVRQIVYNWRKFSIVATLPIIILNKEKTLNE